MGFQVTQFKLFMRRHVDWGDNKEIPVMLQNYIELLDDNEYYDITVEVGKDPNVKIFRSHKIILCRRSPCLRRSLASSKNQCFN
uniref:Uncharacterized protein n=1 Tax=Rhizophagus irregularis (strain DAOM 181602 / DAOM 197198 / MUCL 43194) TaxID=747089 RepID=U9SHT7_RHIID